MKALVAFNYDKKAVRQETDEQQGILLILWMTMSARTDWLMDVPLKSLFLVIMMESWLAYS